MRIFSKRQLRGRMRLRLVIALVLLAAFASGSWGQSQEPSTGKKSQPQQQTKQPDKGAGSDQRGTPDAPVVVKILPTQKSDAESENDKKERDERAEAERKKTRLDEQLVDFNGDLAYYTKALVWVAVLQFLALIGQVIFLRLSLQESRRATDTAREAMVAGERAFVFATAINPYWEIDSRGLYHWRFRPNWKNSGDTPTKHMYSECVLRTTPLPEGFDFNYPTRDWNGSHPTKHGN